MEQIFLQAFQQNWQIHFPDLQPSNSRFIVAVSGGVDSVVLAHILKDLGFDFIIAHCNFHLRGEESNRDENFVKDFAKRLEKSITCKDFDTVNYADECKLSIEEAARELRYKWFRELAEEHKLGEKPLPFFVAHHANDNIETVLMNFFRGCGIAGLHGILPINNGIYRPLLFAKRKDIISYALSHQLEWVEDSTNIEEKYRRNFLRHSVIPELQENYPTIEDNLLENIKRFREVESLYNSYIGQIKEQILQYDNGVCKIEIAALKCQNNLSTIVYELFKDFGFSTNQTSEIIKLIDADSGAKLQSDSFTIWKDRTVLIVATNTGSSLESLIFEESDTELELQDGSSLTIVELSSENSNNNTIVLDKEKLHFPLKIRHWQEGDFFYPNGMLGKKKLAKFFVDLKIPSPVKHKIWVLTSDDQIVWIMGYRADRRFLADQSNANPLVLKYTQK